MSLLGTSYAKKRAAMAKLAADMHRSTPDQPARRKANVIKLTGMLLDKYTSTENNRTTLTIMFVDPTSAYTESRQIKNKERLVADINKETCTVKIAVNEPASVGTKISSWVARGVNVERNFDDVLEICPQSTVQFGAKADVSGIPKKSVVSIDVTVSSWIIDPAAKDVTVQNNTVRVSRYINVESISVVEELSDDLMYREMILHPQMLTWKMRSFKDLAAQDNWTMESSRKQSSSIFIMPITQDPNSDDSLGLMMVTDEGGGCSISFGLDKTQPDNQLTYMPAGESDSSKERPAVRFSVNWFFWESEAAIGKKKLFQLTGGMWGTAPFHITNTAAWKKLGQRVVVGKNAVKMMLPFTVDYVKSAESDINLYPERFEQDAHLYLKPKEPIVAMTDFIVNQVPVSHRFAKQVVLAGKMIHCDVGADPSHSKSEEPIVRTISEMSRKTAEAFMSSPVSLGLEFYVLTLTPFSAKQTSAVRAYNDARAAAGGKLAGPGCEALLFADWDDNNEAFREEFYGSDADESDVDANYTDDHPLMGKSVPPVVSMRDDEGGVMFFYMFAVNRTKHNAVMGKHSLLLEGAERAFGEPPKSIEAAPVEEDQVADVEEKPTAPGAPKKAKRKAEDQSAGSEESEEESATTKRAKKKLELEEAEAAAAESSSDSDSD